MLRSGFGLLCFLLLSCKSKDPSPEPVRESSLRASAVPVAAAQPSASSSSPSVAVAKPSAMKKYRIVLQTGDSMVGGGLCRALKPKFEEEGVKFHRDVVESGTIHDFAQKDHLPKLLKAVKPDLVLMTLGANHIPHYKYVDVEKEMTRYVELVTKRLEGIDCYWIAPPIWKPEYAEFNRFLERHVSPCKFYDGSALVLQRKPDKIHPDEKGGEVWADDFWKFFKGEGAFYEQQDAGSR